MTKTTYGQNGASVAANPRQTERSLLAHSNDELKLVDPLVMNLLVARGIPSLAKLNIFSYEQKLLEWSNAIRHGLREVEHQFHQTPWHWKNDINFFRLGYLCYYVDEVLGIRYRDDQKALKTVRYIDPNDLFLNGVIDTKQGTCANMAALHVALGWRLKWPVSLACVGAHLICRYDDGKVTHNIEATKTGDHGFHSHPDEYYLAEHRLRFRFASRDPHGNARNFLRPAGALFRGHRLPGAFRTRLPARALAVPAQSVSTFRTNDSKRSGRYAHV